MTLKPPLGTVGLLGRGGGYRGSRGLVEVFRKGAGGALVNPMIGSRTSY